MEHTLRCNSLKCRGQLEDRAVVTTCSHIFCLHCSDSLGLTDPQGDTRVCPACNTQLSNPDDAVVARLKPSEDYKTSVLSGLTPTIILECASRALSFYNYQTSQEIIYQEYLAKSLTEKAGLLHRQLDDTIDNANAHIAEMHRNMEAMSVQQQKLENQNHQLATAFKEKSRKQQQLQKLYTQLKQQQMASGIEIAADLNADSVLHNAAVGSHDHTTCHNGPPMPSRGGSIGSDPKVGGRSNGRPYDPYAAAVNRQGMHSSRGANVTMTPSGHRQSLSHVMYGNGMVSNGSQNTILHQGTPRRTPLGNLDTNMFAKRNCPSVGGMSAGIKIPRPAAPGYHRDGISGVRPLNVR